MENSKKMNVYIKENIGGVIEDASKILGEIAAKIESTVWRSLIKNDKHRSSIDLKENKYNIKGVVLIFNKQNQKKSSIDIKFKKGKLKNFKRKHVYTVFFYLNRDFFEKIREVYLTRHPNAKKIKKEHVIDLTKVTLKYMFFQLFQLKLNGIEKGYFKV